LFQDATLILHVKCFTCSEIATPFLLRPDFSRAASVAKIEPGFGKTQLGGWPGIYPRQKVKRISVGFTGCGKTRPELDFEGSVTGHDFSRADKANQINVGL
jgi:hypothetical protein